MPLVTWIDDEGRAISREIPESKFVVWLQNGSINLNTTHRQPAYRVPAGGKLIIEAEHTHEFFINFDTDSRECSCGVWL